jgi:hypothetical protein
VISRRKFRNIGKRSIQNLPGARPSSPLRSRAPLPIGPLAWIQFGRSLHERLLDPRRRSEEEKTRLAREVEGALFTAESTMEVSRRARVLFFRLRTHVHQAAMRGAALVNNSTTWRDYAELESLAPQNDVGGLGK